MRKAVSTILICVYTAFTSCNKKNEPSPVIPENPPPTVTPTVCTALPEKPEPFGWYDSTIDVNRNINSFLVNPISPEEVIYIVNGDVAGYNKMFSYHIPSKQTKHLANIGEFLPSMNSLGWLVYSTADNNIFKIKANGDSLQQLTQGNYYQDPRWDHTGQNIYFYRQPNGSLEAQLMRSDQNGDISLSLPISLPNTIPFNKSNQIIFLKTSSTKVTLVKRDMNTQEETILISGPYYPTGNYIHFDDLTIDKNDDFIYWSNTAGIFKCNLQSLKTDTVLKNCPRRTYLNPIISQNDNELTVAAHIITPINAYTLFHEYKCYEYDLLSGALTERRILH